MSACSFALHRRCFVPHKFSGFSMRQRARLASSRVEPCALCFRSSGRHVMQLAVMASSAESKPNEQHNRPQFHRILLAAALSSATAFTLVSCSPAMAQVESLNAQQALSMARPFPKQQVDKNAVWALFVASSTLLFLGTVLVENNSGWFPAISRANQAMNEMRQQQQQADQQQEALQAERAAINVEVSEVQRQSMLVEQELAQARARVLSEIPQTLSADEATSTPQPTTSNNTPVAEPSNASAAGTINAPAAGPSGGATSAVVSEASSAGAGGEVGVAGRSGGSNGSAGGKGDSSEAVKEIASSYVMEAKQALAVLKQQAAAAGVSGVGQQQGEKESEGSKV